ncbi:MAG: acyl-CoA thioester hydrolase [Glaciecola sp.]|jgi:acyl-CoA thioester hydrolase
MQNTMTSLSLNDFAYHLPITTRWMDNDMYGHVNNVHYYSYFDTVINQFLIEKARFDPVTSQQIGFIVKSSCEYLRPVSYPEKLTGGFKVERIGNSSVDYIVGIFNNEEMLSAIGQLRHVFVERQSQKPMPISGELLAALKSAM